MVDIASILIPVTTKQSRPARSSMRRARVVELSAVVAAAALAFAMALGRDSSAAEGWLPLVCIAIGMGLHIFLRGANVARKPFRLHGPNNRYLTARTWTGVRTVDLAELRRVGSGRPYPDPLCPTIDLVLRDAAGTRVALRDESDLGFLRGRIVTSTGGSRIRVTRLARADLGIAPARWWRTGAYTTYSIFEMCFAAGLPLCALSL
ncbi:hypothetical protein [Streptomyces sp. SID3343]|uniref:hypothetical protein n=1 Tax=Streptomyces sp. SID3343 TaxID=2690260 RepID=UPI00136EBB83|nr:hypothetical protein [Streptomyces sp. SID3343]MYW03534.1 hypothetical protein [Streptomyces sp. SID3343]